MDVRLLLPYSPIFVLGYAQDGSWAYAQARRLGHVSAKLDGRVGLNASAQGSRTFTHGLQICTAFVLCAAKAIWPSCWQWLIQSAILCQLFGGLLSCQDFDIANHHQFLKPHAMFHTEKAYGLTAVDAKNVNCGATSYNLFNIDFGVRTPVVLTGSFTCTTSDKFVCIFHELGSILGRAGTGIPWYPILLYFSSEWAVLVPVRAALLILIDRQSQRPLPFEALIPSHY